jgi:hypothetical protein
MVQILIKLCNFFFLAKETNDAVRRKIAVNQRALRNLFLAMMIPSSVLPFFTLCTQLSGDRRELASKGNQRASRPGIAFFQSYPASLDSAKIF